MTFFIICLSEAILFSGNTFGRNTQLLDIINIAHLSRSHFHKIQKHFFAKYDIYSLMNICSSKIFYSQVSHASVARISNRMDKFGAAEKI